MKYLQTYESYAKLSVKKLTLDILIDEISDRMKEDINYDKDKISEILSKVDIDRINKAMNKININKNLYTFYPEPFIIGFDELNNSETELKSDSNIKDMVETIPADVSFRYVLLVDKKYIKNYTKAMYLRFKIDDLEFTDNEIIELGETGTTVEMDGYYIALSEEDLIERLKKDEILQLYT